MFRSRRTVHRPTFGEYGGRHTVARRDVGNQFREQVDPIRAMPEVMVRIDNGLVGFDDVLVEKT